MSWLDDIIRNNIISAFDNPAIQEQAKQAIIRVLDDKEVLAKIYMIVDARIKVILSGSDPVPPLEPPVEPPPVELTEIVICDLATLPEQMRADGILLKDNAIYYGVACAWAGHWWTHNEETAPIIAMQDRIHEWFELYIQKSIRKLQTDLSLTATAIAHDGRDRLGFIIGHAIMERFKEFGDRVTMGQITPESEY